MLVTRKGKDGSRRIGIDIDGEAILDLHLSAFAELQDVDRKRLRKAISGETKTLPPRRDLISEGDNPTSVRVLLEGWAMRYKELPDGRRQILSFFIPGDLCDANVFILNEMDHSVGSLTPIRYTEIAAADFTDLLEGSGRISKALWWSELVKMSIQREWTLNLGQRDAYERMAHLFCELVERLKLVGMSENGAFHLPLTQHDLAEATGMTPVHANRTLQRMRSDGLIELSQQQLSILDPAGLSQVAKFNPNYLHLSGTARSD